MLNSGLIKTSNDEPRKGQYITKESHLDQGHVADGKLHLLDHGKDHYGHVEI